jgi:vacuolar-type H+-ATPase subunit I/STV1
MKKDGKANKLKNKVMYILSGSVLTEDFFVKNTFFIAVVLILMVLYISNRYNYIEQVSKIESLQKELKDAKYEYQTVSSQLTAISRQSQVIKLVEQDQLGLEISNKPSYEINTKEDAEKEENKKKDDPKEK